MSEEILRIFLSDLDTIRIICQKCNGIAEFKIDDIRSTEMCAFCRQPFVYADATNANVNPLGELGMAIKKLKEKTSGAVAVEFPIKAK